MDGHLRGNVDDLHSDVHGRRLPPARHRDLHRPPGFRQDREGGVGLRDDRRGPLVARYDANANGTIEKGEVIKAINDYLFGEGDEAISKAEVIELINRYLFG